MGASGVDILIPYGGIIPVHRDKHKSPLRYRDSGLWWRLVY